jgi:hypothetical protein
MSNKVRLGAGGAGYCCPLLSGCLIVREMMAFHFVLTFQRR